MADLKRKFRAEDGLDAGGDKIVNVALADRTVGSDGVNVDFLVQENTVQEYDQTRGYLKDFVVVYDNRLWRSSRDIDSPAGDFNEQYWIALRTDPKWITVDNGPYALRAGDTISVDTASGLDMVFTLPGSPIDGDTIILKDIGGLPGYTEVKINASIQSIVNGRGEQVRTVTMTHPRSEMVFVFSNRLWQLYISDFEKHAIFATPSAILEAQSNDFITRRFTSDSPIQIKLPRNANHGDVIEVIDLEKLNPLFHTVYTTFDDTTSIREVGTHTIETRTSGGALLVFDAVEKLWRVWTGDIHPRLRIIRADVNLRPNEEILVYGVDNSTPGTINVTLPTSVEIGDSVKISMNYMRKGQTVKILATKGDVIATDINLLQFPKRSSYPPDADWVEVTELEFNGTTSYVPVLELSYVEDTVAKKNYWVVQQVVPTVERVDSSTDSTRARVGVIALATQDQANTDHENSPEKELAITPETLSNRVATEARRGIARIATTAQVNQNTDFAFQDDLIISPKKLNERTATETRRGIAEIATQAETNQGVDDTTIITPKKLEARQASETLSGIVTYTSTTGTTPATSRDTVGTNVYNKNVDNLVISPKALDQYKADQNTQGSVYLATQEETNAGQTASGFSNAAVTPETLGGRRATDTNHGLIEIATQDEVNTGTDYTRAVTPKTLNDRKATEGLSGIAEIATQEEFDTGTDDTRISSPLKIKTHFNSSSRTSVNGLSGLTEQGTLWDHYTLDILEANETQRGTARLATQDEANQGNDDKTIITPLKLHNKKATETTEGIIEVADLPETVAGVVDNKAVSPKNLIFVAQQEVSWEATPLRRGFVKLTEGSLSFAGDTVVGSGITYDATSNTYSPDNVKLDSLDYRKTGYSMSPYEVNKTLQNFLPVNAWAVGSYRLNGLTSDQFIRRDIDQTVNGSLTLTKQLNLDAPLVSSSSGKFASIESTSSVYAQDKFTSRDWTISTETDVTMDFINGSAKLSINKNGNVNIEQTLSAGNRIDADKGFSVEGGTIVINPSNTELVIGTQSKKLSMLAADANTFTVTDASGSYNILNTKNAQTILNPTFVRRDGSSMTGSLSINNATFMVQIPESSVPITANPSSGNSNQWSATITSKTIYDQLPGYVVPIMGAGDAGPNTVVVDYLEVKGPGILTQYGIGSTNVYQMWCPRPTVATDNHNAQTFWTRNFDAVRNAWGGWSRLYTSNNPPTVKEIGGVGSAGTVIDNLTVRDWIQIGNVRITPNKVTQSVDFTWVE